MAIEEYLAPYQIRTNICFDCQKACRGCSWIACNPVTLEKMLLESSTKKREADNETD